MTSERQIEANRKNAERSTGPSTAEGKARSRQNALRHGLSRSTPADDLGADRLAQQIMEGMTLDGFPFELTDVVRAKLALGRIRAVRHELLSALLTSPNGPWAKRLRGLARYERAAYVRQKRVLRANGA
jgi:hypothetical protein